MPRRTTLMRPLWTAFLIVLMGWAACCQAASPKYLDAQLSPEQRVDDLMSRMTLEEKVGQMNQSLGRDALERTRPEQLEVMFQDLRAGRIGSFLMVPDIEEGNELQAIAEKTRLKIPVLNAIDAIHGHCLYDGATVFPTSIGLASSWNEQLVERTQVATAAEMRATGYHWAFFPYMSVCRDPRWGRTGENFGEDPLLVSRMAVACVRGLQGSQLGEPGRVLACVKAFLGDGQSINGINFAPTDLSERTLREIFLPPAKACVDAGARTFMVAHNELNGVPCHANHWLVTEVLRDALGFQGYTISDWMDIERLVDLHHVAANQNDAVRMAVAAGVDVHMHGPEFVGPLVELVEKGVIPEARIDRAVREIVLDKFRLGLFENRYVDASQAPSVVACQEHRDLALEAARQSIVLLKNEGDVLPIQADVRSILVTGPLATGNALLGDWVHKQPVENITTVLQGLQQAVASNVRVEHHDCGLITQMTPETVAEAVEKAKQVDLILAVVGGNDNRSDDQGKVSAKRKDRTGGENIARSDITLVGRQLELVQALHATGKPVVVVLLNGRPLAIEWIAEHVPAIVEAWQPGMVGGRAVADVLLGKVNPSGKLPMTIPRGVGHIPIFYNRKPTTFSREYKFGKTGPLFPFGHGLSYTTFQYQELSVPGDVVAGNDVEVRVRVTNTGQRSGVEIVQLYVNDVVSSVTTPVKSLQDFRRIHLEPGESKQVAFTLTPDQLKLLDRKLQKVLEPGEFQVFVGDQTASFWVK